MLNRRNLRIALAQKDLTLKKLANRTGLDLLRLYRITSKNVRPRLEELIIIAQALDLNPSELEIGKDEGKSL